MVRGPSVRNVSCAIALIQSLSLAPVALGQPRPGPAAGNVSGYIWNAANSPVTKMVVVLRNVGTGQIEGTMTSDENGHVSFRVKQAGTYVLEVVEGRGSVIATGQTFGIEPGESVVTFVRLPARSPWYAGFFNNAGVVAVATAAAVGVTAVGTTGQPQSPGR
jgi:hypothetical protein